MLRRDHVAGAAVAVAALGVFAMSGDLPFGTLASPGAGMLPMLASGLVAIFSVALVVQAGSSPPLTGIDWGDLPHAARVAGLTAVSLLAYEPLGFLVTAASLLLVLLLVERRPPGIAIAVAIGVPVGIYLLLAKLLKSALPVGVLGF